MLKNWRRKITYTDYRTITQPLNCKIWSKSKCSDEKIPLGKQIKVLTFTFQPLWSNEHTLPGFREQMRDCQDVVLAHKETMERKGRRPGSKVSPLHPRNATIPRGPVWLHRDHCAAGQSTLASHWKLQGRLPTQTNPALILLLPLLLLRKRNQDYESHLEVLWAAPAACRCLLRSRRSHSSYSHCSSTGFCRLNMRAASLQARSLVSSQPTCQYQTKPVVCSMDFSPELFKIWQSKNVSKLHGSWHKNSALINFRCFFLAQ